MTKTPSPALLVSFVALFVALAGTAFAIKANSVKSRHIATNAVKELEIAANAVGESEIESGAVGESEIAPGAVGDEAIAEQALSSADLSDVHVFGPVVKATPTSGADFAAALGGAPKIPLVSKGPLSVYGKCFQYGSVVAAWMFMETEQDRTLYVTPSGGEFDGSTGEFSYLNTNMPETSSFIAGVGASNPNTSKLYEGHQHTVDANAPGNTQTTEGRSLFYAIAPDGTVLAGMPILAVKRGDLPFGNGPYGAGDSCLFSGFALG